MNITASKHTGAILLYDFGLIDQSSFMKENINEQLNFTSFPDGPCGPGGPEGPEAPCKRKKTN